MDPAVTNVAQSVAPSGPIYAVLIDCTSNPRENVYLKIKNAASIASVSACRPDHQFYCAAGKTVMYSIPEGFVMNTGISYYASVEPGVGGATAPSGTVIVRMIIDT